MIAPGASATPARNNLRAPWAGVTHTLPRAGRTSTVPTAVVVVVVLGGGGVVVVGVVLGGVRLKVALGAVSALTVTVQLPDPEQPPPLQPAKVEPELAAAVKVTCVPEVKSAEHVAPQSIPAGLLVTVPEPLPGFETLTLKVCGGGGDALPAVIAPSALRLNSLNHMRPSEPRVMDRRPVLLWLVG